MPDDDPDLSGPEELAAYVLRGRLFRIVVHALAQPANRLSLLSTDMEEELPVPGDPRFAMIRQAAHDWGSLARSYNPSDVIGAADTSLGRLRELAGHFCAGGVLLEAQRVSEAADSIRVGRRAALAVLNYVGAIGVTGQSVRILFTRAFNDQAAVLQLDVLTAVTPPLEPDRLGRRVLEELVPGWEPLPQGGLRLSCGIIGEAWECVQ